MTVMAGLVPAIHVFTVCSAICVDARVKPGHDEEGVLDSMTTTSSNQGLVLKDVTLRVGGRNTDSTFTDLNLAVASDWKTKSATDTGPWKVRYTLTQAGTTYSISSDNNVSITEQTPGCAAPNVAPVITWTANPSTANEGDAKTYSFSIAGSNGPSIFGRKVS